MTFGVVGATVHVAKRAAQSLAREGIDVAVLDLRWLESLDMGAQVETVAKSQGRVLIGREANVTRGFGAETMARLLESGYYQVHRLGSPDIRVPASPVLRKAVFPNEDTIGAAVRGQLAPVLAEKSTSSI